MLISSLVNFGERKGCLVQCVLSGAYGKHFAFVHPDSLGWIDWFKKTARGPHPSALETTLSELVHELRYNPEAGREARRKIDEYNEIWNS